MRIEKIVITIVVLSSLLNLISCSTPQSLIIGKWKVVTGSSEIMEFFRDGSLKVVHSDGKTLEGKYVIKGNLIEYHYGVYRGGGNFSVSRNELILYGEAGTSGEPLKLHRIE